MIVPDGHLIGELFQPKGLAICARFEVDGVTDDDLTRTILAAFGLPTSRDTTA
jgi:hypothetical protein